MGRDCLTAMVVVAIALELPFSGTLVAADRPSLAGRWTLNRASSQIPREVGFSMDLPPGLGADSSSRGEGTRVPAGFSLPESEEDAKRKELLVDEVRDPSPHLTVAQTDSGIAITDERGRSRTFHPDGREETQTLDQVRVATTARWDADRLEVTYKVERNRELHYTYSRTLEPPQLVVQVKFIERGGHDVVTLVYEPAKPNEPVAPPRPPSPDTSRPWATPPPGTMPAFPPAAPANPATAGGAPAPTGPPRPDAELGGIRTLGLVVEDLSPQAAACGLSQSAIEAAVSKSLTDAGFKVLRNSDEDTYVYVQVITTSAPGGLCVSRYDVSLTTHATTPLPYRPNPVLVQVQLLHSGGIAGGPPGAHADAVLRNVKQYVDAFVARIRAASR
jgi:hypothetical protein